MSCELCDGAGGEIVWSDARCRVVQINDPDYPGFCRVIWREHKKEMTDLGPEDQRHLMRMVFVVETALRRLMRPDKVNLASLGNMTPHVHWHVIPRFHDDRHYPQPVWGTEAKREFRAVRVTAAEIARSLEQVLSESESTQMAAHTRSTANQQSGGNIV